MHSTKWLGIDFGTVRLGFACADQKTAIAFPITTYTRQGEKRDATYIQNLVQEERVNAIVVGLPVRGDGSKGEKANEALRFGEWLAKITGLPVRYYDERYSTFDAENSLRFAGLSPMKRKQKRDQVAAQIILQSFLDAGCPNDDHSGPLQSPHAD